MKNLIAFLIIFIAASLSSMAKTYTIKPYSSVEIWFDEFDTMDAVIRNLKRVEIEVAVIDTLTDIQKKGFGLNGLGKATLGVERGRVLKLSNKNARAAKVSVTFTPKQEEKETDWSQYLQLTLRNSSAKSIPLMIPNVMNPNLSPMSNSGVSLKRGQEIYFKYKGKKELLLIIDDSFSNGDKIEMATVIKNRKAELDAE